MRVGGEDAVQYSLSSPPSPPSEAGTSSPARHAPACAAPGQPPADDAESASEGESDTSSGGGSRRSESKEAREDLLARLRRAVEETRAKAGLPSVCWQRAVEVMAYSLTRTARRRRRARVETEERFCFREKKKVSFAGCGGRPAASVRETMARLFGEEVAEAALADKPLVADPPDKEEEAVTAAPLFEAQAEWRRERARQLATPFVAGSHKVVVALRWRKGLPLCSTGSVLAWGTEVRVADLDDAQQLAKLIGRELAMQALEVVGPDDVDVVTPVFVALHPVTGKPRLVHDLRAVNVFLLPSTVDYDRVTKALCGARFAAKLDILAAFKHCALRAQDSRKLAFCVDGVIFRWRTLNFGCSQSPELFAAALAAVFRELRAAGVVCVVYVDDILVMADSVQDLDAATVRVMKGLREEGWYIALDKTFLFAHSKIPFLGLIVDLVDDCLRVSISKASRLRDLCTVCLSYKVVSLRNLQRIGGLLAFFAVAVPDASLARAGIDGATSEAERLPGRTVGVKGDLRENLQWWVRNALSLPQRSLPRGAGSTWSAVATDAPLRGFGGVVWPGAASVPPIETSIGNVRTFASAGKKSKPVKVGASYVLHGALSELPLESSAALETAAFLRVLWSVAAVQPDWIRGRNILWYSDAQAAVRAATSWRSKSVGLSAQLTILLAFCRQWGCVIHPRWVSRALGWMPVADLMSRMTWVKDSAEWSFPPLAFAELIAACGWRPELDLFASKANAHCRAFCSRWPEPGSEGDAFSKSWQGRRLWAFPPYSLVDRVLSIALDTPAMQGLFIIPAGTAAPSAAGRATNPRIRLIPIPKTVRLIDVTGHTPPGSSPVELVCMEITTDGVT